MTTIGTGSDRLDLETHIDAAAAKAHALSLMCDADMFKDYEDGLAVMALIRDLADHAAHARGLFERAKPLRSEAEEQTSSREEDDISIVTC